MAILVTASFPAASLPPVEMRIPRVLGSSGPDPVPGGLLLREIREFLSAR
jgi:hypothetical protein